MASSSASKSLLLEHSEPATRTQREPAPWFARFRRGGGSQPRIVHLGFADSPRVGCRTALQVRCENAVQASLLCWQGGDQGRLTLYNGYCPLDGEVGITPASVDSIHVRLELEGSGGSVVAEATTVPCLHDPLLEVELPDRIPVGRTATLTWHSDGERVTIITPASEGIPWVMPPTGQLDVDPGFCSQPGLMSFVVTAEGRFGGRTTRSRTLQVVDADRPSLSLEVVGGHLRQGLPGQDVRFDFRVAGAEAITLWTPGAEAPIFVGPRGNLTATVGFLPEQVVLCALGHDGREQEVTLLIEPRIFEL